MLSRMVTISPRVMSCSGKKRPPFPWIYPLRDMAFAMGSAQEAMVPQSRKDSVPAAASGSEKARPRTVTASCRVTARWG